MELCPGQVIEKYRKYGFEYKKLYSNRSYLTFTFRSGFFHNAEVVKVANNADDDKEIEKKLKNLNELGISAKITEYSTLNDIEEGLFQGFFDVKAWRQRIDSEYQEYVGSVMKAYPDQVGEFSYDYINAPYTVVNSATQPSAKIVDDIVSRLSNDAAQLILIEAPAGFGKTCTSYELINHLISDECSPIPFFTEFSRDRQARIFSHVFVREVDRAFSQVNSEIVEYELKNGRIVMVLDGFDELLSDTHQSESSEDYENAEPMLETISELLEGKSKIIITSRKSAMFDGATFSEWVEKFGDKFKFVRYRIERPDVGDWLGLERQQKIENVGLNLKEVSNPVLLSYLRFVGEEKFQELCKSPDELVSRYFNSMLEREQERQNLQLTPDEQSVLLTMLAEDMCERNYTSESKDKLVEFFKSGRCSSILENARKSYKASERPSIDSLSNTLSNHAFFDRSNQGEGRIEFVNEFVFGNFIAESILQCQDEWMASDERFVEPAVLSYLPRNLRERERLWDSLAPMNEFLSPSDRFKYELSMLGEIGSATYDQCSIMSVNVQQYKLFESVSVQAISFSDCTFTDIEFVAKNMQNVTFINCKFYGCSIDGDLSSAESFVFLNCFDNNGFINDVEGYKPQEEEEELDELTRLILERYWRVGSAQIDRLHIPLSSIYKVCQQQGYTKRQITLEIKRMKSRKILKDATDGEYIAIDKNSIVTIKDMLGKR
ncbi:NACHT domain-containing protein [Vibrio europaeus]|uniref:NACHT domain-containing protein n=1 Tax=Vibrio europaeus TaxID=300876 RepID=UPI00233EEA7D|nr:NACHT domain-containing protein [Vibrio europaeus]MDC5720151.1 NACHT domain-containing protein [Vibrio europaeus]MDC5756887.1 NACHT domain-containing protein [Vibrio europaeus]MDC5775427.1 NACHT domain-containing protein [Vibrio europaeus]MDC5794565.1 NACHT domain-containing protein [Vibrio europaeus]MDC5800836.1 NACHT domain-containing protein [Vibrio europaeus]